MDQRGPPPSINPAPSIYSLPGGTPDHTPRGTPHNTPHAKLRTRLFNALPVGETPPRRRDYDPFGEDRQRREQAMSFLSQASNQPNTSPDDPDDELASLTINARPDYRARLDMQATRRNEPYASKPFQQPVSTWSDSTQSSPSTSRRGSRKPSPDATEASSEHNAGADAEWVASVPTGRADDVSPAFLAAMKRRGTSVTDGADGFRRIRESLHEEKRGRQREREQEREGQQPAQEKPARTANDDWPARPRPRRQYSDRSGSDAHDATLVSDEPSTSFNPYLPTERYRVAGGADDVNPYRTEHYGGFHVHLDMRVMGRAGQVAGAQPKDKTKADDKYGGLGLRKSCERMREAVGLVDPDKEIAKAYAREGRDEGRTSASTDRRYHTSGRAPGEPRHPKKDEDKHDKKGSISSLFSLGGGRKSRDRREIPPLEPLHVPANRDERLAMGPTLAHTPRDWKLNDGYITRLRPAPPTTESLCNGVIDERARRGESPPPPKEGPIRRLVRRASGPLRRSLSKISLRSKKSTDNINGREDFFLPSPNALQAARPERHACYLACTSSLREEVHKFDECFCDCPGCRPQERRRPTARQ